MFLNKPRVSVFTTLSPLLLLSVPTALFAASPIDSLFFYTWQCANLPNIAVWFWGGATVVLLLILLITVRANRSLQETLLRQNEKTETIRNRQFFLQSIFRLFPYGCALYDMEGRFVMVNDEFCRRHNRKEADFIGQTCNELGYYSEQEAFAKIQSMLLDGNTAYGLEFIVDSDLGPVHGMYSARLIEFKNESYILCAGVDVTNQKRAEAALELSENSLKCLFDHAPLPMAFAFNLSGSSSFTTWNEAWYNSFGYSREDADGKSGLDFGFWVNPEDRKRFLDSLDTANGPGSVEVCLRCKDGSIRNCVVYGRFVGTPGQKILSAVYLDITERRKSELEREKLQNQLSQSQRLESVGQLAGGIAHDYNNMLGVILGHVELSIIKAGPQSIVAKNLVEIQKAAKRSAELTQQLLAFARKQTISPVVFDLNDAVQDTVEMLGWLIGEHIKLSWLPGSGPLPVKMDPNQLDQLLVNLCVNGRDAISGTGRIVIETTSVCQNENHNQEDPSIHPGSYVLLSVTDTGCGMDKETQEKIFEPFYTTKGLGHGTGLGLATVYGVVKQNGGVIMVDSSPGRGSCFKIYMPQVAVKEKTARTCATDGMQTPTGAGQTILVVEDEVGVLEIYTAMLEDLGYNVLAASLPSEAFVLAHEYGDQIDLLLTDMILPEMNGWQVENRIREMIPDIACLFVSGYSADVISHHGVLVEGVHFMQKPFTMQQLAEKVGDALCREAIPAF